MRSFDVLKVERFRQKVRYFLGFMAFVFLVGICVAGPIQTSSTPASTIITNARTYLNEDTASFWSDAQLLVFLNDGQNDIAARALCMEATETLSPLVANTIEYTPTTDYISVIAAVYTDSDGNKYALKQSNVRTTGEPYQATSPGYFYDYAGKIGIFPALSSVTTEIVTLYLAQRPSTLTLGSSVTIPAVYEKALTYYIVSQAMIRDNRLDAAKLMLELYHAETDRFRQDFGGVQKETTDPIR